MKFSKNFKRILSAVLCLCMVMGSLLMLASCDTENGGESTVDDTNDANKVTVVRALKYMEMGTKIERANLEEVSIDKSLVPEGAYATIREVVNKFLKTDVYAGDYLFPDKVAPNTLFLKDDSEMSDNKDYVIVTKYLKGVTGDMSTAIQKAIDENPNKTIYFPDGNYLVHKPIQTSADPEKCVSLRLSNYAVISAGGEKANWTAGKSVVELGAKDSDKSSLDAKYYFIGGYVDANSTKKSKAGALSVCGGNALINNVSIKDAEIGMTIKAGARADIDSCVVVGNNEDTAIGVLVESEENTLTNMRLCHMTTGIKLTAGNNVLRNLHPLFVGDDNRWSAGFYDVSEGNFYDVCYSDQYAISFYMGENTKSIYNGCFGYWYAGNGDKMGRTDSNGKAITEGQQFGFYAANAFNSIIRDTRISLNSNYKTTCDLTYLKVEKNAIVNRVEGPSENAARTLSLEGNGVVLYPRGHGGDEHRPDWSTFLKSDSLG